MTKFRDLLSQNSFIKKNCLLDQTVVPGHSTFTYNISDFAFDKNKDHMIDYQAYISNCKSKHLDLDSLSKMLGQPIDGDGGVIWKASEYYKALERAGEVYDSFSYIKVDLHFLTHIENLELLKDGCSIVEMSKNLNLLHEKISIDFCQAMSHININIFNELISLAQVNEMFAFVSISHHMVLILGIKTCISIYSQSPYNGKFIAALKDGCYQIKLKIPTYVAIRITIRALCVGTPLTAAYWFHTLTRTDLKHPIIPKFDLSKYALPPGVIKNSVETVTKYSAMSFHHTAILFSECAKAFRLGAVGPENLDTVQKIAQGSMDILISFVEKMLKKNN